ncbi:hypothetical protein EVG20_g4956 [Dentipellis fragilis]|uniref:Uncharacterized protein n=1 Tax=Dentipellis fragilis TaxID=205917 RepID=A0A4Y9YV91_9AGAM|nr:hypothetical protein EVG20_g4956 [Dentipellis fragilis]
MPTFSNVQIRLLRRGARIQAAFRTWKAAGSPQTTEWLDNFGAEHNKLYEDMSRVREAKEHVVLHPVAWSLHYRRSMAKGHSDDWILRVSEDDPTIKQILEKEGVHVPGGGEDYEDCQGFDEEPREAQWWKFKGTYSTVNSAGNVTTDRDSRSPASQSLEAGRSDGRGDSDPPNRHVDTNSDSLRHPLPSPPATGDHTVKSDANIAVSPIRVSAVSSTPTQGLGQEIERPSRPSADPQIPNNSRDDTRTSQYKSAQIALGILNRRLSAKKLSGLGKASDSTPAPSQLSVKASPTAEDSEAKAALHLPHHLAAAAGEHEKTAYPNVVVQKRKRTVSSIIETRSKSARRSSSALADVDKEDDASEGARTRPPLPKRRKVADDGDDDAHRRDSAEPCSDDELHTADGTDGTGSSDSKPTDAKTGGSQKRTKRQFTKAELAFMDAAAKVKRPIPVLPPVPYLYPLHKVDAARVGHAVFLEKLRWPKTEEDAERALDEDEIFGAQSQAAPMDVGVDEGEDKVDCQPRIQESPSHTHGEVPGPGIDIQPPVSVQPNVTVSVSISPHTARSRSALDLSSSATGVSSTTAGASSTATGVAASSTITATMPPETIDLLRIVAALQKEVRALRLRLAEQETHSTNIRECLRVRGLSIGVTGLEGPGPGMKEEEGEEGVEELEA